MEQATTEVVPDRDEVSIPVPLPSTSANIVETPSKTSLGAQSTNPTTERLRMLTDASLRFFANASNETLGACAVGLCASTYLVLGRVGLVAIGAIGGIVLHATWERQSAGDLNAQEVVRKEASIEIVKRALDWRGASKTTIGDWNTGSDKIESSISTKTLDYTGFRPEIRAALDGFTDAVIRDYVKWWYSPILPTEASFPAACKQTLTGFILSLSNHLSRKRPAEPFLDFLANSTSILIVFLEELSTALKASQRQEPEDAVRTYLQYQPESNLANVLSLEQQDRKLNIVADDILQNFLESKAYNFPPARSFLREVLAGLILKVTVTTCSQPEWINGWIVYLLEDGEPEIMNVIDEGMEHIGDAMKDAKRRASSLGEQEVSHRRRVSRAEEAMQQALLEAQRMNEMIAEDEARRKRKASGLEIEDAASTATTEAGMATPTSSDSDRNRLGDQSMESSTVFDSEGNPHVSMSPIKASTFTNFEQLGSTSVPTALEPSFIPPPSPTVSTVPQLTLHNASITIFDDANPNDKSTLKQKPSTDYPLQIEPASSRFPGWMITRKYAEFELLHEKLRRIAIISGFPEFAQKNAVLPPWKGQTRSHLSQELENYLRQSLQFEPLAESEAMKNFLDKETGLQKAPAQSKNALGFASPAALENVGKGFVSVFGQGGKGIAGGGKAVLGGVQGVFGAVATGVSGQKKPAAGMSKMAMSSSRTNPLHFDDSPASAHSEGDRTNTGLSDASAPPPLPARHEKQSMEINAAPEIVSQPAGGVSQESLHLPPPPSDIDDNYQPLSQSAASSPRAPPSRSSTSRPVTPTPSMKMSTISSSETVSFQPAKVEPPNKSPESTNNNIPLNEEETRIVVDLLFAIITSLYSLSPSVWTLRLSLLTAAKTYLLRPANPQLESIRLLIQDSLIDTHLASDAGLAALINKTRENTLPTVEELEKWPKPLTDVEKERLREKARRLLIERGMPAALTGVMGQSASGEALGRLFDCLQIEEVARGLIFALLLQGVRAVTQ